jgi:hypothetical protein
MQAFGGDVKYILTEEEYAMHVSSQLFITRFRAGFGKLAAFYKVLMNCVFSAGRFHG